MASRRDRRGGGRGSDGSAGNDWMTRRLAGLGPVRVGVDANRPGKPDAPRKADKPHSRFARFGGGTKKPPKKSKKKLADKGIVLRADAATRSVPPLSSLADGDDLRASTRGEPGSKSAPRFQGKQPNRNGLRSEPRRGGGSSGRPPRGPRKPRGRGLLRAVAYWMTVACLWFAIGIGGLLFYYAMSLPDTSGLWDVTHAPSLSILAADGETLSHRGDLLGGMVTTADMPAYVSQAVVATEDQRYYWHFGVDPIGLARAAWQNYRAGYIVQGGSTITQQLAKNVFLKPDRTFSRKIKEMLLAIWLEARYSKEQILTLYLNRVYFGGGAYGIEGASERFFKKTAHDLTLSEAAMLAGLLKAPSHYSPTNDLARARERASIVLDNMVRVGYISDAQERYALAHPASLEGYSASGSINYFVDWVADVLPGYTGEPNTDLIVRTTIDPAMQRAAEEIIAKALAAQGAELGVTQAAIVAMTPDGSVRAMIGGRSYAQSQFNRAVQALRQPGSAFKPFVYLTAMERGLTPETVRVDQKVTYGTWSPSNYANKFEGPMSLRRALERSVNTVAVQVAQEVGIRNVIRTAQRLGIQENLPANLSLALGSCDVNLLELTAAYAAFANGGFGVIAHGIEEVHDRNGSQIYLRQGSGMGRVMSEQALGEMNYMLKGVMTEGTGRKAALADRQTAGKTGTSQDFRDAWFVGYSADLVVGVWVGNDNRTPMKKVTGGGLPATIWHDFMARTQANQPVADLPGRYPYYASTPTETPVAAVAPQEQAEPVPEPKREWEEPGFFERLFGAASHTDRPSTLQPGHPSSYR